MYTEQDTFDKLRRIPLDEMKEKVVAANIECRQLPYMKAMLQKHGWSVEGYQRELARTRNEQYT